MIKYKENLHLSRVSIIAAMECNLSCDYCVIAHRQQKNKKNNKDSKEKSLFQKTVEALESGEYLENVKKVFNRVDGDRKHVDAFEIWGMEPTLILKYFTPKWKDWYHYFPNVSRVFFSTNGMDHMDDIVAFIKEVEKWSEDRMALQIQVSYDGDYGEDFVRHGSQEKIENNLHYLIKELNSVKLENLEVNIFLHGVLSKPLLKKFAEEPETIVNYIKNSDAFLDGLNAVNFNDRIRIGSFSAPPELNYIYTTKEGQTTFEALRNMSMIESKYFYENPKSHWCGSHGVFGNIVDELASLILKERCFNLDDYVEKFGLKNNSYWSDHTDFCGAVIHDLKITYDGRSMLCQNMIHDLNLEIDPLEPSMEEWAIKNIIDNYGAVNFITATDEEIDKAIYWGSTLNTNNCYNFMTHTIANFMYLLASCGQISGSYLYDEKKLMRHAFLLAVIGVCYYNNMIETGSNIIYSISLIKNYCNGIMDIIEEHIQRNIDERKHFNLNDLRGKDGKW